MGTTPPALSFCYDFLQEAFCDNPLCKKCIAFKVFVESNIETTYQESSRKEKKQMLFKNLLHLTIEGKPDAPDICFEGFYDMKAKGKGKRVIVLELGFGVTNDVLSYLIHEIPRVG
jgi:hypothetical protein